MSLEWCEMEDGWVDMQLRKMTEFYRIFTVTASAKIEAYQGACNADKPGQRVHVCGLIRSAVSNASCS